MESPQIFSIYLLSFGSVMTSLNEEARPARLWISLGMMILVALPSAALPNASSDLRRMTCSDGAASFSSAIESASAF